MSTDNHPTVDVQRGLLFALRADNYEGAAQFLGWGASATHPDSDEQGKTPLMAAAAANAPRCIQRLLEAGARPSETDVLGQTPLHYLTRRPIQADQQVHCINLLLVAGADLNIEDRNGLSPFRQAIKHTVNVVVETLVQNGGKIDGRAIIDGLQRGMTSGTIERLFLARPEASSLSWAAVREAAQNQNVPDEGLNAVSQWFAERSAQQLDQDVPVPENAGTDSRKPRL